MVKNVEVLFKVSTEDEMLPHDPSRGRSFRPQIVVKSRVKINPNLFLIVIIRSLQRLRYRYRLNGHQKQASRFYRLLLGM